MNLHLPMMTMKIRKAIIIKRALVKQMLQLSGESRNTMNLLTCCLSLASTPQNLAET